MQTNLDNYFARFLNKSGSRNATRLPLAASSPSPCLESPAVATAPSNAVSLDTSPEEAAQRPFSPNAAGSQREAEKRPRAHYLDDHYGGLLKSNSNLEEESWVASPVARTEASPSYPSAAPRRLQLIQPTVKEAPAPADDDEDELALLLGSQEAKQVKEKEQAAPRTISVPSSASSTEEDEEEEEEGPSYVSAVAVKSLEWSRSSTAMERVAHLFQRQFETQLVHRPALFEAFEPFLKDRAIARITARSSRSGALLLPAPTITAEMTGAVAGSTLRDYQVEGVQFLFNKFHDGMNCILADDMGLGKTAQISSFLHVLKLLDGVEGPHLIVAPLSTLTGWTRELARWAPQLHVIKYHGDRGARQDARRQHHSRTAVFVTTSAVLTKEMGFFKKRTWATYIVDEAHVLKNQGTRVTTVSRKIKCCFRVAVTGTPVHNYVGEVWSLMGVLYPWLMASYAPRGGDPTREAVECGTILRHIMLRRTKAQMELGIPPRVDEPVTMLEPTYVQVRLLSLLTASALRSEENHLLQGHLAYQRAACNHPMSMRVLAMEGRHTASDKSQGSEGVLDLLRAAKVPLDAAHLIDCSAKMKHLDTLLPKLKAEGHRALIFSNFTSTLDLLEGMCHLRGYTYERLDGSCSRVERELSMLRYNHPKSSCFLFLITTVAGGVGVTLTGADTVILFDAHYNPQIDRQAADRAHRIGQTRVVHVHRLCLRGTVEEHVHNIAQMKASVGDFIVGEGCQEATKGRKGNRSAADTPRITAEEIRQIFEKFQQTHRVDAEGGEGTASSAAGPRLSCSGRDEEDRLAIVLASLERHESVGYGAAGLAGRGVAGARFADPDNHTHHCFVCGDRMRPLQPLYHCCVCPKAYHADCIGERVLAPGEVPKRMWRCPRHDCIKCGKNPGADGAIFMCDGCPRGYCYDCLDPRYLEMDESGARLLHIRKVYPGMETEHAVVTRAAYYITCLQCAGLESSASEEDDDAFDVDGDEDGEEEDEEDEDSDDDDDSDDDFTDSD